MKTKLINLRKNYLAIFIAGRLFIIALATLYLCVWVDIASCFADSVKMVTIQAKVLDSHQHPVKGATLTIHDANHNLMEDPGLLWMMSGTDGKVNKQVAMSGTYYVQADANGYLPRETKVECRSRIISILFMLKRAPLPTYSLTTIRAKILDSRKQPIPYADLFVFDKSGHDLGNLFAPFSVSGKDGRIEKTIRSGGIYRIQASAPYYRPAEVNVRSKPGIISLVFRLKPNNH